MILRTTCAIGTDSQMHGGVCAVGEDLIEGHILEMVRTELGHSGRLVLSLALHANFTRRILECADAVTAYRIFPTWTSVQRMSAPPYWR